MKHGNRIAILREQRKMTQEELAQKVGITRAALSHYENNRREPDYKTLEAIANYFQVSTDYLMGRTMAPSQQLDIPVRQFIDQLELSDHEILERFNLTIDGKKLTSDEARRFIAFVRAERSLNS